MAFVTRCRRATPRPDASGATCTSPAARAGPLRPVEHLAKNVLPAIPVRQWVLSFPRRVHFLAARHPSLASRLLDLFTRAVFAWQRRVACRLGVVEPRTGGDTAVQRFGVRPKLEGHPHGTIASGARFRCGAGGSAGSDGLATGAIDGTALRRTLAFGAKTPWHLTAWTRGGSTSVASRAISSSGVSTSQSEFPRGRFIR